jgi:hypothetical protein
MCTYFAINICLNKGKMTDGHFYTALIILSLILVYILLVPSGKETFVNKTSTPVTLKEKMDIINDKKMYAETKETIMKLKKGAADIRKNAIIMYPKVKAFAKDVMKCVQETARKSKLTEKFLSLS